ncbi:apolipoprotein N-acyltransferase [Helicobacter bizzozeronii]|uniref:apolipoprotein N-acyltransferase n=1 Tax=Helicobacter bizzozeronii TaxID=56877 RepID=UPI001F35A673|nr:apolipoprotein N-acyltransferase [Helicobacter bizzozeronii]
MRSLWKGYGFACVCVLLFLLPVYSGLLLAHHPMPLVIFGSFSAPLSVWAYLSVPAKKRFFFGFWVGLGLFYWCALSFRYNDNVFLLPLIMVLIALCYAVVFYGLLYFNSLLYRIATLWLSSYIHPFGFDWFVPDAFFAYSGFKVDRLSFLGVITAIALFMQRYKNFIFFKPLYAPSKILAVVLLVLCINWKQHASTLDPNALEVVQTNTNQKTKWQPKFLDATIAFNLTTIQQAIQEKKQVVILPETAFPIALNKSNLIPTLLSLSQQITIIAGALYEENDTIYNSTYVFDHGDYHYAHKVILAPFGERMPLPSFLADYLDRFFFGADVFKLGNAPHFSDMKTQHLDFRPLVCYEGTSRQAYENSPPNLVVISNNAWFVPSIEPFLQRMLLKYYARRFNKTIIHSANLSPSYILTPALLGDRLY